MPYGHHHNDGQTNESFATSNNENIIAVARGVNSDRGAVCNILPISQLFYS